MHELSIFGVTLAILFLSGCGQSMSNDNLEVQVPIASSTMSSIPTAQTKTLTTQIPVTSSSQIKLPATTKHLATSTPVPTSPATPTSQSPEITLGKVYHNEQYQYDISYPVTGGIKEYPELSDHVIEISDPDGLVGVTVSVMTEGLSSTLQSQLKHISRIINGNKFDIYYGNMINSNASVGGGHGTVPVLYAYLSKHKYFYALEFRGISNVDDKVFLAYMHSFHVK